MNSLVFLIISSFAYCVFSIYDDGLGANDNNMMWSNADNQLNDEGGSSLEIAALVAVTGDAGFLGKVVKAGFERAMKDQKELCRKSQRCQVPTVHYSDTKSLSNKALQLFQQYYSRGVRIFVGLVTSNEAETVAKYASQHAPDAILFSPTSTATGLCRYKNLRRMTMDDRGYAEVLFDLSIPFKKPDSTLFIQVLYRNDIHGRGLYNDISKRFGQASREGYKLLSPISYNEVTSSEIQQLIRLLHNSRAINEKHSLIVLIGLSEAQFILQEAAKHSSLKRHTWILSDALTLSNIQTPPDMNVLGLGFVGDEASSNLLNKERRGLMKYLDDNDLPPMTQAQLAYDLITYVLQNKGNSLSQYTSNTMVIEGLTGPLEFSRCGERTSGLYVFAASPKKKETDNVLRKVFFKKWLIFSRFVVESDDRGDQLPAMLDDNSPEARMEVELQSTSKKGVSSVASPSVQIKKSEFLKQLVEIGDDSCNKNAQLIVQSHDELSQKPVNVTYAVKDMPESMVFPARYGFIMIAKCHTSQNLSLHLTRVCPPTKVGGSEVICQTRVSSTTIGRVSNQGRQCRRTTTASFVCYTTVFACSVAVIVSAGNLAPVCGLTAIGCAILKVNAKIVCQNGKFVCTELFRQGYLPPDIILADMSFASHYSVDNPITRKGYDILGPAIASWMSSSEIITNIAKSIAIPWAEEMAYNEGYREVGNEFGALVMSIGSVICGAVGAVYIYSRYIIGGMILIATILIAGRIVPLKVTLSAKKLN